MSTSKPLLTTRQVTPAMLSAALKNKGLFVVALPATDNSAICAYSIGVKISAINMEFLTKKAAEKCFAEYSTPEACRFNVRGLKPSMYEYTAEEVRFAVQSNRS